jgi:hypothetical protein
MNTATPTLEQMINMKLDERTNENKQMDNILLNIQKHGNNGNYNKQDLQDGIDLQDEELQMYRMQNIAMGMGAGGGGGGGGGMGMPMQNTGMQNTGMGMGLPMQNTGMGMGMPMQNTGMGMGMGMPMQNTGMGMGMPMQNTGMGMPMQNMGMQNMHKKHEINDLDNLKTKKVISYIKNPLIVFIIFIILNLSIIIQTINNLLGFCNNASIISIINLIIRGLLASLLYIIITNILINV